MRISDWSSDVCSSDLINNFQVKLAKFAGKFDWHHHEQEDEFFLVVGGRMKMGFRDRDVIVEPGEFIIVPHGTEHRPEALDSECHVLMIEPNSTLNTGNVEPEKTRSEEHTSELQSIIQTSYTVL